jgi:hypothetical protein
MIECLCLVKSIGFPLLEMSVREGLMSGKGEGFGRGALLLAIVGLISGGGLIITTGGRGRRKVGGELP